MKEQVIPDICQGLSRIDKQSQDKEDSIFDRHFNDSAKGSARYDLSEVSASNDFKSSNLLDSKGDSGLYQLKEFTVKSQHFESTDENIFTPQDLLNECRNFLKHRENPMKDHKFEQPI